MKDGFTTSDLDVATAICYLMDGFDTLTQINMAKDARGVETAHFGLDCASCDGDLIRLDFLAGQLAISDLLAWTKIYARIVSLLKTMRRSGRDSWASPDWVSGRRA